ncbi:hypothetical protein RB595_001754 [Gaeumannomyces hyphopodioides]
MGPSLQDTVPAVGLTVLVAPDDPAFDLVFVHGFTGHPKRTWLDSRSDAAVSEPESPSSPYWSRDDGGSRAESSRSRQISGFLSPTFKPRKKYRDVYWPQKLLPETAPSARVMTFGYDTNIKHRFWGQISKSSVYDISRDLLVSLTSSRASGTADSRPLIFIAHSLGGIVVKELLRQSWGYTTHQRHLHSVFQATRGVIFFGTPHGGSDPRGALQHVAENLVRAVGFSVNRAIVSTLLPTSERLRELRDAFGPMAHDRQWLIHSFQEQYGIALLGGAKVVEDASSCLGDATVEVTEHIASNHMDMCRFSSTSHPDYLKFAFALRRVMGSCLGTRARALSNPESTTADPNLIPNCDDNGFLWIMGNPGTGKSTVMKFVIDYVRTTRSASGNPCLLSFFFHNRGAEEEKTVRGLYRTFLRQIIKVKRLHPSLPHLLEETHVELTGDEDEEFQWSAPLLQTLLFGAITRLFHGESLICFIDALDECADEQARELVSTLQKARRLASASGVKLLVCISSRHFPHISVERRYLLVLERIDYHYQDIARYIGTELNIGQGQFQEKARQELIQKSRGSFLWVVLVVASLNEAYDKGLVEALEARMREIPGDVASLFAELLNREDPNHADTYHCLLWVLHSRRPLDVAELYTAILRSREPPEDVAFITESCLPCTKDMARFITNCARGLVEILPAALTSGYETAVQFIHETVIDFLSSADGLSRLRPLEAVGFEPLAHDKLASVCQKYWEDLMAAGLSRERYLPFQYYSSSSLNYHAQRGASAASFVAKLDPHTVCYSLMELWGQFAGSPRGSFFGHMDSLPKETILLFACQFPLYSRTVNDWLFSQVIKSVKSVDAVCNGISPLTLALEGGRVKLVDLILQSLGLLGPACSGGLIKKLVQENRGKAGLWLGEKAKFSVVKWHPTLLSFFVAAGVTDMVRQLIRSDRLDVNAVHYTGRTPLVFAIERGHDEIAILLLQTGRVDLRARFQGRTALITAVSGRRTRIIEQLLQHHQILRDINAMSPLDDMATALLMAIDGGPAALAIVRALLSVPEIDVNCNNVLSRSTPLHTAVECGEAEIVDMLLAHPDVDANKLDSWGDTAAMRVARCCSRFRAITVLEVLLRSPKVDFNRQDTRGYTLLAQAVEAGNAELVRVLLASGRCDANLPDRLGYTPYRTAVIQGRHDIVSLLADTVPDLDVGAREVWAAGSV